MTPIYAVGDIHGHLDQLDHALALIEADGGPEAEIVFIGDYVDRGPDSPGVLDRMIDGLEAGRNWTCLLGNHDRIMSWYIEDARHEPLLPIGYHWLHDIMGGRQTLEAYGIEIEERVRMTALAAQAREVIPARHRAFLRERPICHQIGPLFFAHAGIRPGVPLRDQTEDDLIWIRQEFLNDTSDHGVLVVHGHTPADRPTRYVNRVNVDGGAAFGRPLIPVVFEGTESWTLTPEGRQPL